MAKKNKTLEQDGYEKVSLDGKFVIEMFKITNLKDNEPDIEIVLWHDGIMVDFINISRRFYEKTEAITYAKDVVIPLFIFDKNEKDGTPVDIKYLSTNFYKDKLIDKILYDFYGSINYLTTLNLFILLEKYGIIPPGDDDLIVKHNLTDFELFVDKINFMLINRLKTLGFRPDRNVSNIIDHEKLEKDKNTNNLIYTRGPFVPGFKMIKAGQIHDTPIKHDYLEGMDLSVLERKYKDIYDTQNEVAAELVNLSSLVVDAYESSNFEDVASRYNEIIAKQPPEFKLFWKKQKPTEYKNWYKGYNPDIELPNFVK